MENVESVAKVSELEDPELLSFHRHTKVIAAYREIIYENNLKTSTKEFWQLKIERTKWTLGAVMQHSQDMHLQVTDPQIGRISQSHKERGFEPHAGMSWSEDLHQEDIWLLKTSWVYSPESRRAIGNR